MRAVKDGLPAPYGEGEEAERLLGRAQSETSRAPCQEERVGEI